jgi:dTDP-4-dehydrorhamnose reductase
MKILLLGARGQIGRSIQALSNTSYWPNDWQLYSWSREISDLSQPDVLIERIQELKPELIWNTAAYTQVDRAEEESALAYLINAQAVSEIAKHCAKANIPFVHYSTDYVYSGSGETPHLETEEPSPINEYGRSKLAGDLAIQQSGCEYLIFRTSWVFSEYGKNFVKTMYRLSKERPEISVVSDQVGSPSYAADIALYSLIAIKKALFQDAFPSGIYHLCNSDFVSWYDFARGILPNFPVKAIASRDFPTTAKRPANSRLSLKKISEVFDIVPRSWKAALLDCEKKLL